MTIRDSFLVPALRLKLWAAKHTGEIFWAAIFAVIVAVVIGWLTLPAEPRTIYFVVARHTNNTDNHDNNQRVFQAIKSEFEMLRPHVGDAPVEVAFDELPNKSNGSDTQELAVRQAQRLSSDSSTLLVIGQLNSQATEAVLPLYFGFTPQVPFIATVATDDKLLPQCAQRPALGNKDTPKGECKDFVPLLQLPPTNESEGAAAVLFALQNGKSHFVIITDTESPNQAYVTNLKSEFEDAVQEYRNVDETGEITIENEYETAKLPADGVAPHNVDCILYAGSLDKAKPLFNQLGDTRAMIILSDSAMRPKVFGNDLKGVPAYFMSWNAAQDRGTGADAYAWDAFWIAKQLIDDLDARGSWWFQMKASLHLGRATDIRKELVRIMKENSEQRIWYSGRQYGIEEPTLYAFKEHKRVEAPYHVWQSKTSKNSSAPVAMCDVDGWHRPLLSSASQSACSQRFGTLSAGRAVPGTLYALQQSHR